MHVGSGEAKKVWHLPEKLLKSKSTFFTAALEGGFAEGLSKSVALPEEDPGVFKNFIEWLYVGFAQSAEWDGDGLVLTWILGDRLGCLLMQNDVMCKLIKYYDGIHITVETLKRIYELSTPESKIRRYVIGQCLFDVRYVCSASHKSECSYSLFVKDNENFSQQLAEATIFLGMEEPDDPTSDESPYLCAPPPCTSKPSSGS